ncbi:MAG: sigma factor-like helix-turn-helix DNA-binding protein [bacterium]
MKKLIRIEETNKAKMSLNYDISTYEFFDMDLEMAIKRLASRDQELLILYLMGHTHDSIAKYQNVDRSTVSKRLSNIINKLSRLMNKF